MLSERWGSAPWVWAGIDNSNGFKSKNLVPFQSVNKDDQLQLVPVGNGPSCDWSQLEMVPVGSGPSCGQSHLFQLLLIAATSYCTVICPQQEQCDVSPNCSDRASILDCATGSANNWHKTVELVRLRLFRVFLHVPFCNK